MLSEKNKKGLKKGREINKINKKDQKIKKKRAQKNK